MGLMNEEEEFDRNISVLLEEIYYLCKLSKLIRSEDCKSTEVSEIFDELAQHNDLSNFTLASKSMFETTLNRTNLFDSRHSRVFSQRNMFKNLSGMSNTANKHNAGGSKSFKDVSLNLPNKNVKIPKESQIEHSATVQGNNKSQSVHTTYTKKTSGIASAVNSPIIISEVSKEVTSLLKGRDNIIGKSFSTINVSRKRSNTPESHNLTKSTRIETQTPIKDQEIELKHHILGSNIKIRKAENSENITPRKNVAFSITSAEKTQNADFKKSLNISNKSSPLQKYIQNTPGSHFSANSFQNESKKSHMKTPLDERNLISATSTPLKYISSTSNKQFSENLEKEKSEKLPDVKSSRDHNNGKNTSLNGTSAENEKDRILDDVESPNNLQTTPLNIVSKNKGRKRSILFSSSCTPKGIMKTPYPKLNTASYIYTPKRKYNMRRVQLLDSGTEFSAHFMQNKHQKDTAVNLPEKNPEYVQEDVSFGPSVEEHTLVNSRKNPSKTLTENIINQTTFVRDFHKNDQALKSTPRQERSTRKTAKLASDFDENSNSVSHESFEMSQKYSKTHESSSKRQNRRGKTVKTLSRVKKSKNAQDNLDSSCNSYKESYYINDSCPITPIALPSKSIRKSEGIGGQTEFNILKADVDYTSFSEAPNLKKKIESFPSRVYNTRSSKYKKSRTVVGPSFASYLMGQDDDLAHEQTGLTHLSYDLEPTNESFKIPTSRNFIHVHETTATTTPSHQSHNVEQVELPDDLYEKNKKSVVVTKKSTKSKNKIIDQKSRMLSNNFSPNIVPKTKKFVGVSPSRNYLEEIPIIPKTSTMNTTNKRVKEASKYQSFRQLTKREMNTILKSFARKKTGPKKKPVVTSSQTNKNSMGVIIIDIKLDNIPLPDATVFKKPLPPRSKTKKLLPTNNVAILIKL